MRLRRRPGRPISPYMDEVYADLHRLTELVLLTVTMPSPDEIDERVARIRQLHTHLTERLAAQEKELEIGLPPEL